MEDLNQIAERMGLPAGAAVPWGKNVARLPLELLRAPRANSRYVLVSGVNPTKHGEGKTTVSIGLTQAMRRLGKQSVVALRQSSLGPAFGIKGGGAGGGKCRVLPFTRAILHLTGDMHVVGQAHNLLAAMVDNSIFHGNPMDIDPDRIQLRRVMDVNDRYLRHITIGQGGEKHGIPRDGAFEITAASELMAVLALVDGTDKASVVADLRKRIGRIVVAWNRDGKAVTADDIQAGGAVTATMLAALEPNLLQTTEGAPVLLHAGPFANIAHGCSSIIADRMALGYADIVITEAGFGMDIGGEKFFDIKCQTSGLYPNAVVIVATVRALRAHAPDPDAANALELGAANLVHHIGTCKRFGVPVLVGLNRHADDSDEDVAQVLEAARAAGAAGAEATTCFADGGAGAEDLARAVLEATAGAAPPVPNYLYPLDAPILEKLRTIATVMYGADDIRPDDEALESIARLEAQGYGGLPICMAKTPLSLSGNPRLKGVPRDFTLRIRDVRVSAGAGFLYALGGRISTMPGLGRHPAAFDVDVNENGEVVGLF